MIDDPLVAEMDWRLQACTRITGPGTGPLADGMQVGDPIHAITNVSYGDDRFVVSIPSGTALYLNTSFKQYEVAKKFLMRGVRQGIAGRARLVPDSTAFDFFEAIMAAVVFGYTALECFANEEIPEDFYFEKKYKEIWGALGKQNIERTIDLRTKLKTIIPRIYGLDSVGSTAIWPEFLELEETRNRIIHLKTVDRQALHDQSDSIWHRLFRPDLICPHYVAKRVMKLYYDQQKIHRDGLSSCRSRKIGEIKT